LWCRGEIPLENITAVLPVLVMTPAYSKFVLGKDDMNSGRFLVISVLECSRDGG